MTLLDERGRIGGRINLVDAVVAGIVIVMIPLAIGAYLLFRTPPPSLAYVTPATLVEGPRQRIEINGANLRPFMRVTFNTTPAAAFLLGSTKYALVEVPPLKPGIYDVVLYDYAREVARLKQALTIAPIATDVEIDVEGAFKSPSDDLAVHLQKGRAFIADAQPVATILEVGQPVAAQIRLRIGDATITVPQSRRDLPATLRLKCYTVRSADGAARCVVPGQGDRVLVAPDALLTLATPGGPVIFQITAARAPQPAGIAPAR